MKSKSDNPSRPGRPRPQRRAAGACVLLFLLLFLLPFLWMPRASQAQTLSDDELARVRFEQNLNAQISLSLPFRDEEGTPVRLSRYFGRKPVVLVLGYYECPMLCTLVLNGMVESAADMKWSIGREFEVVDVSINPQESPALAAGKKRTYLKRYGRSGAAEGWHFLTGNAASIVQLTSEVGFHYAYDPASKQYAHASGLVVLTPEGKISKYLFGVTFSPRELYAALREASTSQVGSPIQQLILLCFHYNPVTGKYSGIIILLLRGLGIGTMLGLLWLITRVVVRGRPPPASRIAGANALIHSSAGLEGAPPRENSGASSP